MGNTVIHFNNTAYGDSAIESSIGFTGKVISKLGTDEKIDLLSYASSSDQEELISVVIAMLPNELQLAAVDAFDYIKSRPRSFCDTTASRIAAEISDDFFGKSLDELDLGQQVFLMDRAGQIGKEELIGVIISLMPVQFQLHASDVYDRTCLTY